MVTIYAINDGSAVIYVGASFDFKKRFRQHLSSTFKNHDSKDTLFVEMIEQCSLSQSGKRELFWINFYKQKNPFMLNKTNSSHSATQKKEELNSVRIDKAVLNRARKYVDGTPMTLSGWISSELRSVLNVVAPIPIKKSINKPKK